MTGAKKVKFREPKLHLETPNAKEKPDVMKRKEDEDEEESRLESDVKMGPDEVGIKMKTKGQSEQNEHQITIKIGFVEKVCGRGGFWQAPSVKSTKRRQKATNDTEK